MQKYVSKERFLNSEIPTLSPIQPTLNTIKQRGPRIIFLRITTNRQPQVQQRNMFEQNWICTMRLKF